MNGTVAIFGGGMAGLTAAHELGRRGFRVTVYDAGSPAALGGKSASQFLPGTAGPGRRDLPGEHGFRFFPGFYRHVIATMFEIPGLRGYVNDDLCVSTRAGIAFAGRPLITFPRRVQDAVPGDLLGAVEAMYGHAGAATPEDIALAAWFRLKYLTSGRRRRDEVYERQSWARFLQLDTKPYSAAYRRFERSIPRTMSAMVADRSSARTIGDITMQMLLGYLRPRERPDQVLCGPTTVRWIEPWREALVAQGVAFVHDTALERLLLAGAASPRTVHHAVVRDLVSGAASNVSADWYVGALPLDRMREVVSASSLGGIDPGLDGLLALDPEVVTSWMVGAQFFLGRDVPICGGHVFYPDSAWALTSISQAQFWAQSGQPVEALYGDGTVEGVLSVDVSDWSTKSPRLGLDAIHAGQADPARDPRDVILDEIFRQVQDGLGAGVIDAGDVLHRNLDRRLVFDPATRVATNPTRLLIHPVGSWQHRPAAALAHVDNLFLAADYVRTHTQLATMEGANEAARHAVNALLERADSGEPECAIWPLVEEIFGLARAMDDERFALGLPHVMDDEGGGIVAGTLRFLQEKLLTDPFDLLP